MPVVDVGEKVTRAKSIVLRRRAAEANNMQTDPHIIMISGWAGTVLDSGRSEKYLSRGIQTRSHLLFLLNHPQLL